MQRVQLHNEEKRQLKMLGLTWKENGGATKAPILTLVPALRPAKLLYYHIVQRHTAPSI